MKCERRIIKIDILKKRFTENKERHLVISFEEAEKMGVRLMNEEEYRYLQILHLAGL